MPDPPANQIELYRFMLHAQPHDVRRALLDRPRRRLLSRRARAARAPRRRRARPHHRRALRAGRAVVPARDPASASAEELRSDLVKMSQSCLVLRLAAVLRVLHDVSCDGPEVREGRPRSGKCGVVPKVPRARSLVFASAVVRVRRSSDVRHTVATVTLATMSRVALLGGGKMGAALARRPARRRLGRRRVSDRGGRRRPAASRSSSSSRRSASVPSPAWAVADADVVVVAVKPGDVAATPRDGASRRCGATRSCCRSRRA